MVSICLGRCRSERIWHQYARNVAEGVPGLPVVINGIAGRLHSEWITAESIKYRKPASRLLLPGSQKNTV